MIHFQHYSDVIESEFKHRKSLNPRFSLRSFARYLEMSPSKLSEIMKRKKGLSEERAMRICKKLCYTKEETEYFLTLVRSISSRSKNERLLALEELKLKKEKDHNFYEMADETFTFMKDWYHMAILEMAKLKNFQLKAEHISKRLGISREQAKRALTTLTKLGFIKDGEIKEVNVRTMDGFNSSALKKYHEQLIDKAKVSILSQDVTERHLSSLTIAIDEDLLPEVFQKISGFRKELNTYIMGHKNNKNPDKLYCLSSQFFNLAEESK